MGLYFQMRKREDLRSQEEIVLIALREWMMREYGQPTDRGYQWKDLFLPHGTRLRIIHRGHCYMAQVEGDLLMAEGKITTPSTWAAAVCGINRRQRAPQHRLKRAQAPATTIFSIRMEPVCLVPRTSTSLPTATICASISFILPAMVISSTGYWITPFSTQ